MMTVKPVGDRSVQYWRRCRGDSVGGLDGGLVGPLAPKSGTVGPVAGGEVGGPVGEADCGLVGPSVGRRRGPGRSGSWRRLVGDQSEDSTGGLSVRLVGTDKRRGRVGGPRRWAGQSSSWRRCGDWSEESTVGWSVHSVGLTTGNRRSSSWRRPWGFVEDLGRVVDSNWWRRRGTGRSTRTVGWSVQFCWRRRRGTSGDPAAFLDGHERRPRGTGDGVLTGVDDGAAGGDPGLAFLTARLRWFARWRS
jgi:hypothetical protein